MEFLFVEKNPGIFKSSICIINFGFVQLFENSESIFEAKCLFFRLALPNFAKVGTLVCPEFVLVVFWMCLCISIASLPLYRDCLDNFR
jgi:hypothetical protein